MPFWKQRFYALTLFLFGFTTPRKIQKMRHLYYIHKYANVNKTLCKTQFVRKHLRKTWHKALRTKIRKCENGLTLKNVTDLMIKLLTIQFCNGNFILRVQVCIDKNKLSYSKLIDKYLKRMLLSALRKLIAQ